VGSIDIITSPYFNQPSPPNEKVDKDSDDIPDELERDQKCNTNIQLQQCFYYVVGAETRSIMQTFKLVTLLQILPPRKHCNMLLLKVQERDCEGIDEKKGGKMILMRIENDADSDSERNDI
jgi:hypothetical protein